MLGSYLKSDTTLDQLTSLMAGGAELDQLSHELEGLATDPKMAEVAKEVQAEVKEAEADVKTTA
jgi:simple sugar transport system ATP-binding protein